MKTILVPVDFSDYSEYALKVAASMATKGEDQILALHMLDMQVSLTNESESYYNERTAFLFQLAKKNFDDFLKKDFLEGVKVVPMIKHFKVFSEVNEVAKKENADIIVMGSHGATGMKELFLGSNTEKVIRFSEIPVLVVKNELNQFDFGDVVYATDFSRDSIDGYLRVKAIVDYFNGKLHVVFVNTPYDNFKTTSEMEGMAVEFLNVAEGDTKKLKDVHFVCDRTVEKGILSFSNLVGADLIALSTHGRKGLSHLFLGSLSEDIANHATLPILTVKR